MFYDLFVKETELIEQLLRCGLRLNKPVDTVDTFLRSYRLSSMTQQMYFARHVLFFLRAGLVRFGQLREESKSYIGNKTVCAASLSGNIKLLECACSEIDDFYDKVKGVVVNDGLLSTANINEVTNEPASLQQQCTKFLRFNLYPNAFYGVTQLTQVNLPTALANAILASDLDDEFVRAIQICEQF